LFPSINICTQHNPPQAYQIFGFKKPKFYFGGIKKKKFMVLQENSQKNIGDEFFKFDCGDM